MNIDNKLVKAIVDGLQDKKGKDIVVLHLTGMDDVICKYIVICTG